MAADVQDTLYVEVEYFTDDEEYGPYYVASNDQIGLTTQGETWDELLKNLREAVDLSLDGEDTVAEYNLAPNPQIVVKFRLPTDHAKTA